MSIGIKQEKKQAKSCFTKTCDFGIIIHHTSFDLQIYTIIIGRFP
jgi:hypothetical protein